MSSYSISLILKALPPLRERIFLTSTLFVFLYFLSIPSFAQITSLTDANLLSICELEVTVENTVNTCNGAEVCLEITNGTAPYTISIGGPDTNPTPQDNLGLCFSGLEPGNYLVRVEDAEGCTAEISLYIPFVDYYIEADITPVSCYGGNDGAIHPLILIDLAPLYFSWEGPNGFTAETESISNLEAGIYSVSITTTDEVCVGLASWEVTQPDPINIDIVLNYPDCGQPDGCLFVSGGSAPYYIWVLEVLPTELENNPSGSLPPLVDLDPTAGIPYDPMTSDTAICGTNLANGTYFVLVVDSHLCYAWESLTIQGHPSFDRHVFTKNASCFGANDGAICYSITGGEPPYFTYLSPSTSNDGMEGAEGCFDQLAPGDYILTTIDANGCSVSEGYTIEQPDELRAEFNITSSVCADQVDGCLTVSGGTQPYQFWVYSWPATYDVLPTVTVNDEGVATIDHPEAQEIDAFPWSPSPEPFVRCAQNIPPGFYLVLIADANGCFKILPVNIPEPNPINAYFELTSNTCEDGADGCLFIEGGTQPYRVYVWTPQIVGTDLSHEVYIDANGTPTVENAQPTDVMPFDPSPNEPFVRCAENIPPGRYLILIVDANYCYDLLYVEIPPANPINAYFEITSNACEDGVDGCLYVEGGTQPYQIFVWMPNINSVDLSHEVIINEDGTATVENAEPTDVMPFDPSPNDPFVRCAQNIPAGRYIVLIVDANHCYELLYVNIPPANPIEAEFTITNEECGQVDGCLKVDGGTRPYRIFVWTVETLDNEYNVLLDANGYPNVDGAELTDAMPLPVDPDFDPNQPFVRCAENIPPGYYLVLVLDANHCYQLIPVYIPDLEGITIATEVQDVSCYGAEDGSIDLEITGGTAPYTVIFNNNNNNPNDNSLSLTFNNLAAGHYSITVYDALQCSAQAIVTVGSPDPIYTNLDFDPYGSYACVEPTGGVYPWTVSWYDLSQNNIISNESCVFGLEPGAYLVSIVDANSCTSEDLLIIDPTVCSGGEAIVDPAVINSGEQTNFQLYNYYGQSIQWQFKTEYTDWLSIPDATEDTYMTPPIHTGTDKKIWVRAVVYCDNGEVYYSAEALLEVIANLALNPISPLSEDPNLFNPDFRLPELNSLTAITTSDVSNTSVFPSITDGEVNIRYEFNTTLPVKISVFNQLGRLVYTNEPGVVNKGQLSRLDATLWSSGAYFIRLESEYGVETHKVIVQ